MVVGFVPTMSPSCLGLSMTGSGVVPPHVKRGELKGRGLGRKDYHILCVLTVGREERRGSVDF